MAKAVESRPTVPTTGEGAAGGERGALSPGNQQDKRPSSPAQSGLSLLDYLDGYESLLRQATHHFRSASESGSSSYAAEWILDNYYIAQQTVRQIREDMPGGYYRQLPVAKAGELAGIPRVYILAQELVAQQDAHLNVDALPQFVATHEEMASATMGELWALPVMLRFAILECLAQALSRITGIQREHSLPKLTLGTRPTDDEIVANCITSLRALSTQDWQVFFETVSQVERILRDDPAGIYPRMEKESRNHYRNVVEDVAKASGRAETEVAHAAVALAQTALEAQPAFHPSPDTTAGQPATDIDFAGRVAGDGHAGDSLNEWKGLSATQAAHAGYYLVGAGAKRWKSGLATIPGG